MARVAVDLVAAQSPSYRNRGIARHGLAFAEALCARHPDLVGSVLVHPELLPAAGMAAVAAVAGDRLTPWQAWQGDEEVFHLTSAFEPEVPIRTLWPRRSVRAGTKLAVTVYDLIPEVFPDMYLQDPGLRRRWRVGREVVRAADHVFTLSDSGADDVVRLLGVAEARVSVIGAGVDARFSRGPVDEARAVARSAIAGLGPSYLVCNGAIDPRKNLPRLVEAYAALPERLRAEHQLVLPCRAKPLDINHFMVMAERLGIPGRVVMPGFVDDDVLVALYRSARLTVFPSLYEGYGLPVVEAMACGAPVIAADNSSLRELVAPEARFDALDVASITAAIERALTDAALAARLDAASSGPVPGWAEVADRAAAGYERLLSSPRLAWRSRPVLAVVAPMPASDAPMAAPAAAMVDAMRSVADVDVFTRTDVTAARLVGADRANGGYDGIVVVLDDHPDASGGATVLLEAADLPVPPVVVAGGASVVGAFDPGTAAAWYPGAEPHEVGGTDAMRAAELPMVRAAAAGAAAYLVPDAAAAALAAIDAGPDAGRRVGVLDLAADPAAAATALVGLATTVEVAGR